MHRFRKKADLKKQRPNQLNENTEGDGTQPSPLASTSYTELPADFRTSLILPQLTKRFSVLRKGEIASPANNSVVKNIIAENVSIADTGTAVIKGGDDNPIVADGINNNSIAVGVSRKQSSNGSSNTNSGQSLSSNIFDDDVSTSNSLSSLSSTSTSVHTSLPNSLMINDSNNVQEISSARKFYGATITSSVIYQPYSKRSSRHDSSQPLTSSQPSYVIKSANESNVRIVNNDGEIDGNNDDNDDQKGDTFTNPSTMSNVESRVNELDDNSGNRISISDNLAKYTPLPSLRLSGDYLNQTLKDPNYDGDKSNTPSRASLTKFLTNGDGDGTYPPPSPRSPLDKLSDGLRNLSLQSLVESTLIDDENSSQLTFNFTPEPPSPQQTTTIDDVSNSVSGDRSLLSPMATRQLIHSKSLPSLHSANRNSPSSPSTIYSPSRVMNLRNSNSSGGTFGTSFNSGSPSTPDKHYDVDYEADDDSLKPSSSVYPGLSHHYGDYDVQGFRESSGSGTTVSQFSTSSSGAQIVNVVIESQVKLPLRNAVAPPKPQPPPLSLTDTLIASGQSDIAHQVMAIRRAQNSGHNNPNLTSKNPLSKRSKQKIFSAKTISGPKLISSSSNVKSVPIVTLGNEDDKSDKFRRKFSLRENESGIGKSLRRIKDVFTNDNEENRGSVFGRRSKNGDGLSPNSSVKKLPKKFVSEEDLSQLYIKENKGTGFVKRRAFSTREHRPNESLRRDIRNNLTLFTDDKATRNLGYGDEGSVQNSIHNFSTSSEENISITGGYWNTASESDLTEDSVSKMAKPRKVADERQPMYDIDALKRHMESVTSYSSKKKDQYISRQDSISASDPSSTTKKSSRDPLMSEIREEEIGQLNSARPSDNPRIPTPKLKVDIPTESTQSLQSPPAQSANSDSRWGITGSESNPNSPLSSYSPVSTTSSSPPPILPRNPLRNSNEKNRQLLNRTISLNRNGSIASSSTSGSDERRDSRDSRTSSNSKSSDINLLQVPSLRTSITEETVENQNGSTAVTPRKQKNKVVRRTIIITKPNLPPLPEVETSSADTPSPPTTKIVNLKSTKTKFEGIFRLGNPDDANVSTNRSSDSIDATNDSIGIVESKNVRKSSDSSNQLSVPSARTSLSRPPTPIPSLSIRESVIEPPYGIPIPPIPLPHRLSVASKRASRSSTISAHSTSSKYRKSVGGKSVHSSYGESLFDYYNYSDQEGADDEGEENRDVKRKTGAIDSSQWSIIRDKEFDEDDLTPEAASFTMPMKDEHLLADQQLVEVLEMEDGSFVWQVVNGLRGEDRFSYYYDGSGDENQLRSQELYGERDFMDYDEEDEDYHTYGGVLPSPLHLPG
ncbi:5646_t:CDS:2, partial [Acaulospora colombiana]